jgi:hypothetical protein
MEKVTWTGYETSGKPLPLTPALKKYKIHYSDEGCFNEQI